MAAACGSKRATSVTSKQCAPRVKGQSSWFPRQLRRDRPLAGSGLADCGGRRSRPASHQRTRPTDQILTRTIEPIRTPGQHRHSHTLAMILVNVKRFLPCVER
jgi:hypothetical protein